MRRSLATPRLLGVPGSQCSCQRKGESIQSMFPAHIELENRVHLIQMVLLRGEPIDHAVSNKEYECGVSSLVSNSCRVFCSVRLVTRYCGSLRDAPSDRLCRFLVKNTRIRPCDLTDSSCSSFNLASLSSDFVRLRGVPVLHCIE